MVYYLILLVYLDSRDSISSVLKFSVGVSQKKVKKKWGHYGNTLYLEGSCNEVGVIEGAAA